jgi:hypothetical protein
MTLGARELLSGASESCFQLKTGFCVGGRQTADYRKWTFSPKHDDGGTKDDAVCSAVDFQVQLDSSRTQ